MPRRIGEVIIGLLFLLPLAAWSQSADTIGPPGCGDPEAKFSVKSSRGKPPARADDGKALLFFIQNDENFNSFPKPTTRAGVDGKWIGATRRNSYLYVPIAPGVHHICASWQFGVILGKGKKTAAAHFTAESGGVYYYEIKDKFVRGETSELVEMTLTPLDSDEGQLLANEYDLATARLKK
jgi:hypothetical protein